MYHLWLGSQAAYLDAQTIVEGIQEKMSAGLFPEDKPGEKSHLIDIQDGVGVISVRGSLTNKDSPWNRFFGATSYNEIRTALVEAASDPTVKQIVLDIDSPGGFVAGLSDTAEVVAQISKVKPITAFTDGNMLSAAYWLGSHAKKVVASNVAQLGSIGILMVHKEFSKQMKDNGVTATVMRGGKYKALVNPYEELTKTAKDDMQAKIDYAYEIFVEAVAKGRGVSYEEADQNMAQGREFVGEQAVDAGLADKVQSFDKLLSSLQQKAQTPNSLASRPGTNLRGEAAMKRVALTPQRLAAIEAGAAPNTVEQQAIADIKAGDAVAPSEEQIAEIQAKVEAGTTLSDDEQAIQDVLLAEAAAQAETDDAEQLATIKAKKEAGDELTDDEKVILKAASDKEAAEAEAAAGASTPPADETGLQAKLDPQAALTDLVKDDLKTASAALLKAEGTVETMNGKMEAMTTTHDGLMAIAGRSIQKMQVALGGSAVELKGMTADKLLELHASVQVAFAKAFKVEGVAADDLDDVDDPNKVPAAGALHTARVKAVRLHKG